MRHTRAATTLLITGLALALALAGCSGTGSGSNDPVVWYDWNPNGPAMQAMFTTTLVLKDGCLMGAEDQYIAFPRDLGSWNSDTNTLTYGGTDYAVGDTIYAPGGGGALPRDATVPEACNLPSGSVVWLVQTTRLN